MTQYPDSDSELDSDRDLHSDPRLIDGSIELGSYLGGGGTSRVYEAYDTEAERLVAVKIARPHGAPSTPARFAAEAMAMASVRSPGLVKVLGHGFLPDGRPYLVMERVRGKTLLGAADEWPGRRMPWQTAVPIAVTLLDALGVMHRAGLVHRDVKPANIILREHDRPVLVDFGYAQLGGGARLTPGNRVVGTPGYIPPEVLMGEGHPAPSADVYAVGVTLYQLLSGALPFEGDLSAQLVQIASGKPRAIGEVAPEVPATLVAVIERAMSRRPEDRFDDATAMGRELRHAIEKLDPDQL